MKNKMGRAFIALLTLSGLYACTGPKKTAQQTGSQPKAWKIVLQTIKQPLSQASKAEIEQVKAEQDTIWSTILLTDNFYKRTISGEYPYKQIINRRDSVVYVMIGDEKKAYRYNYGKRMQNKKDTLFSKFRLFPDSGKTIHGKRSHKAVYTLAAEDSVTHTAWYSTDFPDWLWKDKKNRKVPGLMLEQSYIKNHIRTTSKAISIDRVHTDPSRFLVPEGYAIVGEDGTTINSTEETPAAQDVGNTARDSVLAIVESVQPDSVFKAGSVFTHGFARVQTQGTTRYIDASGRYAFDKILARYHPVASITPSRPGFVHIEEADSVMMYLVVKNGKTGLISSETGWALPPEYDDIRKEFDSWLAIKKDGKTGYADTWGNIKVPASFEEVNIMDGNFFDVKKGNKWGIYSAKKQQLVLPAEYDKFDYCGGCGGSVKYAYASKNGEWGVINFQGEVLVPFKYEHSGHHGMRSDEWVTSFEKDGRDVLINMAANKVYGPPEYTGMELISGLLALQKEGKYGFMSTTGEQLTDFKYDDISDPYGNFSSGPYIRVYINDKAGIINNKGEVIIPADTYDMVNVSGDYFIVSNDDLQGLVNASRQVLLPTRYDNVGEFYEEVFNRSGKPVALYEVRNDTSSGFYNVQTDKLVEPQFSSLRLVTPPDSVQSYIEVKTEKEFDRGLYSIQGEEIMPSKYVDYHFLGDGFAETQVRGKYGLYDLRQAKEIAPPEYLNVAQITDRYYYLRKTDCCDVNVKMWDTKKGTFFSLPFGKVKLANEGLLIVNDSTNTYLYNLPKKEIISKGYPIVKTESYSRDGITGADHGLFRVRRDGKYGYINAEGETVIPAEYDGIDMSEKGLLQLKKTITGDLLKYQYADTTGRFLSRTTYSYKEGYYYNYPYRFQNGNYLVISNYDKQQDVNEMGLMDLRGNEIVPPEYDKVTPSANGNGFLVKKYRTWGVLDEHGNVLMPPVLDRVYTLPSTERFQKNMQFPVLGVIGDHYFYITHSGQILPVKVKSSTAFYRLNRWGY